MVNKWLIINTLQNNNIVTNTLQDVSIDTNTINAGNFAVTACCHIGSNMVNRLIKCYLCNNDNRNHIYGGMYYTNELAIFAPNGTVEYIDISISDWADGAPLSEYLYKPDSNFKLLSRKFDTMAYSLLFDKIVHCDIKPENIIVNSDYNMTLIDNDALWSESFGEEFKHEVGTFGYHNAENNAYVPPTYIRNYSIVLISIMLASLSWEYNTMAPYIQEEALLNPHNRHLFVAALNCAKDIFKRSGDRPHAALCNTITPPGTNFNGLIEKMYNAAYIRSEYDMQMGIGPFYDV